MPKLKDIVAVCKSKNAGPFELTIDAVFSDLETFEKVKATGVICPQLFVELYGVKVEDILFTVYDAGLAFKAGDLGDTDVYGAQQHAPLLEVDVPI